MLGRPGLGQASAGRWPKQRATEELITITPYEAALHAVEQLTSEERQRLQDALVTLQTQTSRQPSGAALVAMLDAQPSDPVVWEEIGRIIEDECERIDLKTW